MSVPDEGTWGRVYSKSIRQWFDASVGTPGRNFLDPDQFTVYFEYDGRLYRKHVRAGSGQFLQQTAKDASIRTLEPMSIDSKMDNGSYSGSSASEDVEAAGAHVWRVKKRWRHLITCPEVEISVDRAGRRGLANLGNTCFMNAALQVLSHIEPLALLFLTDIYRGQLRRKNRAGSGAQIAEAFAELQKDLWQNLDDTGPVRQPIALFRDVFADWEAREGLEPFFDKQGPQAQHDGQEFLSRLFHILHEDVNQAEGVVEDGHHKASRFCTRRPSPPFLSTFDGKTKGTLNEDSNAQDALDVVYEEEAARAWMEHLGVSKSFFEDVFGFQVRISRTCRACNTQLHTYEQQKILVVPIINTAGVNTVPDMNATLLGNFFQEEEVEALCEVCRQNTMNQREFGLQTAPNILIIALARFVRDSRDPTKFVKDFSKVDLQQDLDLKSCIPNERPLKYKLIGVINHLGSTIQCGHYTATCKNPADGKWYNYDDANVTPTEAPLNSESCYVCVYERQVGCAKRQTISRPQTWPVKASKHNSIMELEAMEFKFNLLQKKQQANHGHR